MSIWRDGFFKESLGGIIAFYTIALSDGFVKRTRLFAAIAFSLLFISPSASAIPEYFSVQGRVLDSAGAAVSGSTDFEFVLYDSNEAGKNILWSEARTLDVSDGVFNAVLGDVNSAKYLNVLDFNSDTWLGIIVEGEAQTPLIRHSSAGSAFVSKKTMGIDLNAFQDFSDFNSWYESVFDLNNHYFQKYDINAGWYGKTDVNAQFVPYVGAVGDINLGVFGVTVQDFNVISAGVAGDLHVLGLLFGDGSNLTGVGSDVNGADIVPQRVAVDQNFSVAGDANFMRIGVLQGSYLNNVIASGDLNVLGDANFINVGIVGNAFAGGVYANTFNNLVLETDNGDSIAIGLNLPSTVDNGSTLFGSGSGNRLTTGSSNTFIGKDAGYYTTSGGSNTIIGFDAGFENTGSKNTYIGLDAGYYNPSGNMNTALGMYSGFDSAYAGVSGNVNLGYHAGHDNADDNRLFIDNQDRITAAGETSGSLVFGVFDITSSNQFLHLNSNTSVKHDFNALGDSNFSNMGVSGGSWLGGDLNVAGKLFSHDLNQQFVPYVGAVGDINLGVFGVTVQDFNVISAGVAGDLHVLGLLFGDGSNLTGVGSDVNGADIVPQRVAVDQNFSVAGDANFMRIGVLQGSYLNNVIASGDLNVSGVSLFRDVNVLGDLNVGHGGVGGISAPFFFGDGSGLTGVSAVADVNGEDITPQRVAIDQNLSVAGDANFADIGFTGYQYSGAGAFDYNGSDWVFVG